MYRLTDYSLSGGSAGGTPVAGIDGCTVWLKADAITGKNDGDSMTAWEDSAQGNDFVSLGVNPIFKTNIINGKPIIRFAGNGYFGGRTNAVGFIFTFFIVSKFSSIANDYTGLVHYAGIEADGTLYIKSNGKTASYGHGAVNIYDGTGLATYDTDNWNISTYLKDNNGVTTRRNKTLDKTVSPAPSAIIKQTLYIGRDSFTSGRFFSGDIAEFILYNRGLTSVEIASVEEYLNTKYALGL